jgi:hypothetical protein
MMQGECCCDSTFEALALQPFLHAVFSVGDIVDVTSHFEEEQMQCAKKGITLTPHLWLLKMMLGGIDPTYDEEDEGNTATKIASKVASTASKFASKLMSQLHI